MERFELETSASLHTLSNKNQTSFVLDMSYSSLTDSVVYYICYSVFSVCHINLVSFLSMKQYMYYEKINNVEHSLIIPQLCIIYYVWFIILYSLYFFIAFKINYLLGPKLFYLINCSVQILFVMVFNTICLFFHSINIVFVLFFLIEKLVDNCHFLVISIFFKYLSLSDYYLSLPLKITRNIHPIADIFVYTLVWHFLRKTMDNSLEQYRAAIDSFYFSNGLGILTSPFLCFYIWTRLYFANVNM